MAIVSHRYRFIFLKTRKTASGTCELVLGRHCGPEDLLLPTKDGTDLGVTERNNSKPLHRLSSADLRKVKRRCKQNLRNGRGLKFSRELKRARRLIPSQHSTAVQVKRVVGEELWQSYFTFCFERNPFDRLVSFYHWRIRPLPEKPDFDRFARIVIEGDHSEQKKWNAHSFSNRHHYMIDEKLAVDRVCRFEDLEGELRTVSEELHLPWDGWLPHTKGNIRPQRAYREYYTPQLRSACEAAFAVELELLWYDY